MIQTKKILLPLLSIIALSGMIAQGEENWERPCHLVRTAQVNSDRTLRSCMDLVQNIGKDDILLLWKYFPKLRAYKVNDGDLNQLFTRENATSNEKPLWEYLNKYSSKNIIKIAVNRYFPECYSSELPMEDHDRITLSLPPGCSDYERMDIVINNVGEIVALIFSKDNFMLHQHLPATSDKI